MSSWREALAIGFCLCTDRFVEISGVKRSRKYGSGEIKGFPTMVGKPETGRRRRRVRVGSHYADLWATFRRSGRSAKIAHQVHHSDLDARPRQANGPDPLAAHGLVLGKHMLHGSTHFRTLAIGFAGARRQRAITISLAVNVAAPASFSQQRFMCPAVAGAVRPDIAAGHPSPFSGLTVENSLRDQYRGRNNGRYRCGSARTELSAREFRPILNLTRR